MDRMMLTAPICLDVTGCQHKVIDGIIKGTYICVDQNHDKPVYKKTIQINGLDVMIYYWDSRDGDRYSGWWFGPKVGADQVWVYHPDKSSATPPMVGWQIPHDGPADYTIIVSSSSEVLKPECSNDADQKQPVAHADEGRRDVSIAADTKQPTHTKNESTQGTRRGRSRSRTMHGHHTASSPPTAAASHTSTLPDAPPKQEEKKRKRKTSRRDAEPDARDRSHRRRRRRSSSQTRKQTGLTTSNKPRPPSPTPWLSPASLTPWTVPTPASVQHNPTHCLVYGAANVTTASITREIARVGSMQAFTSGLDKLANAHIECGEYWLAGASWGLAFLATLPAPAQSPEAWKQYNIMA